MFAAIANVLVRFLSHPAARFRPLATARTEELRALLQPGDVLLVEGNTRIGALIRYATQSTWSHAALYVGEVPGVAGDGPEPNVLIEADLVRGVCAVPLSTYEGFHTRICRPAGLTRDEASRLVGFMAANLGKKYDLKRVFGLARYSLPLLPARLRRGRGPLPERGEPGKAVLLDADRAGVPVGPLPRIPARQQPACRPASFGPLRAARFRRLSLLRHRQAGAAATFRLVRSCARATRCAAPCGRGRAGLGGGRRRLKHAG